MAASGESANAGEVSGDVRIRDLLGAPRELLAVLNRTLPQRMNARVTESLEHAMTTSLATGEMCVTMEGDWVAGGQLVNAGDARSLEEGAGLLAFKRELRDLESALASATEWKSLWPSRLSSEARSRLVELEDAVVLVNEAIGREERDAMARELTATQLTQEIERTERHLRVIADDAAALRRNALNWKKTRHRAQ